MNQVKRHLKNVPGKYWIDCEACFTHGLCEGAAPSNIRYDKDGEFRRSYYVYKQPETAEEERQCQEAIAVCPMDAVHNDGDRQIGSEGQTFINDWKL